MRGRLYVNGPDGPQSVNFPREDQGWIEQRVGLPVGELRLAAGHHHVRIGEVVGGGHLYPHVADEDLAPAAASCRSSAMAT
jgi:hypothetical protein